MKNEPLKTTPAAAAKQSGIKQPFPVATADSLVSVSSSERLLEGNL